MKNYYKTKDGHVINFDKVAYIRDVVDYHACYTSIGCVHVPKSEGIVETFEAYQAVKTNPPVEISDEELL